MIGWNSIENIPRMAVITIRKDPLPEADSKADEDDKLKKYFLKILVKEIKLQIYIYESLKVDFIIKML